MAKSEFGSIRKKGSGWEIRWFDSAGKRKSKTIRGTKKDARAALSAIQASQADGLAESVTLSGFWESEYMPEIQATLAPSTVAGYQKEWKNNIAPCFGDRLISGIKGREIQDWIDSMSYGSARHAKAVLSAIIGRAHALDYVSDNVMARRYRLPKREVQQRAVNDTVADYETLERLAMKAQGEEWEAGFLAAAFSGCRRSEAFGLTANDVIPIETPQGVYAALKIERGVQVIDGEVRITGVKTRDSNRWAVMAPPFSSRIIELAEQAQALVDSVEAETGIAHPFMPWLNSRTPDAPNPERLVGAYRRWFGLVGERYIPFKNLRNSYTTNMHTAGMELEDVAKLLGHTTDSITYRHYDRPDVEDLVRRVQKVAD